MATFSYGEHTKKRIGVWLRVSTNPDVLKEIQKSGLRRKTDGVQFIIVHRYNSIENKVCLQIWCQGFFDLIRGKRRYNVFYIWMTPNPEWSCECDMGKGYQ